MTIGKIAGMTALGLTLTAGGAMACPMHEQSFTQWDTDKDSQLSQAEFETGVGASGDFGSLDADASGMLSQEEFGRYLAGEE